MSGAIALVVFDVGGVLVRTGRTFAEDVALAGFDIDSSWLEEFEGRRAELPRLTLGEIALDEHCALVAAASNGVFTPEDVRRIAGASLIEEYAGVGAVLDAVEAAGLETALLTNLNEVEWARYFPADRSGPNFPTVGRVRHRFASHLLGVAKPDRRIYEHVEEGTGRTGSEILLFDDRLENVEDAQALGWTAELIDPAGDTASQVMARLDAYGVIPR